MCQEIVGMAVSRFLVPCRHCGHRNHWGKKPLELLKMWLSGTLPNCNKCAAKLDSCDFILPFKRNSVYLARAREELSREGVAEVSGLVCRDAPI
jgi:hypothetical protein